MPTRAREALLDWFDRHARTLPWRGTRDPYAIWVSEVMLQQTRVDTVVPYYARFLERFPTPRALAEASEDAVLAAWSGLGYYRRARLLKAGVSEVVARYGGEVPKDAEARRSLPGVGRYTAGAIGSIAFDLPEPIVDGNVARVLSRVHRIETPLGRADTEKALWERAEAWARGPRPGALNQALMELGATVCTPTSPRCDACPLAFVCEAEKAGLERRLPVPRAKKAPRPVTLVAVVATRGSDDPEILLVKGKEALFGGLYGVPMAEAEGEPDVDAAHRVLRAAGASAKLEPQARGPIEHVLSHRKLRVLVFRATGLRVAESSEHRAIPFSGLAEVGVSRLTRKVLEAAGVTSAGARGSGGRRRRS